MSPAMPKELHPGRIAAMTKDCRFGRTVILSDSAGSTNSMLAAMAGRLPEGTLLLTGDQRAGKGRKGRSWYSSSEGSLVFSLLLRPRGESFTLTALLALSAAVSIERTCGGTRVDMKWPNDLYTGGRKVAGILAENSGDEVILGMGIDVNDDPSDFPGDLACKATSLKAASGIQIDRGRLLADIMEDFSEHYSRWEREGFEIFRFDMQQRLMWIGETVTLEDGDGRHSGIFEGISGRGFVMISDGQEKMVFSSGDLTPGRNRPGGEGPAG
ncbi:MAG TPA: biotin--[acetyl-CoA-carboxylase] ligase [Candidatus Krumholzibacterium sp.]|nr:biotin--[acetyl-CoA-carboxylase] ligase [Candidatus Krumholzibacterium sp.]